MAVCSVRNILSVANELGIMDFCLYFLGVARLSQRLLGVIIHGLLTKVYTSSLINGQ